MVNKDWMKQGDKKATEHIEGTLRLLKELSPNKNYKEIEKDGRNEFDTWFKGYPGVPTIGEIEDWWIDFFKPYFQEEMHDKAVEELEEHEMSNLEKQQHIKRLSQKEFTIEDLVSNANPLEKAVEELESSFYSKSPAEAVKELEMCHCKEDSCKKDCAKQHTHKTFFCEKCNPEFAKAVKPESKNECKYCKREHGDLVCREYVNAMVKPESSWEDEFQKNVPQTDGTLLDSRSHSDPYLFGYKHMENGAIHTVTDWGNILKFIRKVEKEAYERGGEFVAEWMRNYAKRICTNDVTNNMRPKESEMVVSESLIKQALETLKK